MTRKTHKMPRKDQFHARLNGLEALEGRNLFAVDFALSSYSPTDSLEVSVQGRQAIATGEISEAIAFREDVDRWMSVYDNALTSCVPLEGFEAAGEMSPSVPTSPITATPNVVNSVQDLFSAPSESVLRLEDYLQADVSRSVDPQTGTIVFQFRNVRINVGQLGGDFLKHAVTTLHSFTEKLEGVADALTKPLLNDEWAQNFTTVELLRQFGYAEQAKNAQSFANAVHAVNRLNASMKVSSGWVEMGDFTAQASAESSAMKIVSSQLTKNAAKDVTQALNAYGSTLAAMQAIPGLKILLGDPQELLKLATGESTDLFSYAIDFEVSIQDLQQRLMSIPLCPLTLTSVDIGLDAKLAVAGGATFGFDSSGFSTGHIEQGFFLQDARLATTLSVGLSGTLNEANLIGYRITGAMKGSLSIGLDGADSEGKIRLDQLDSGIGRIVVRNSLDHGITSTQLGPKEMLNEAFKQFLRDPSSAIDPLRPWREAAAQWIGGRLGVPAADVDQLVKLYYGPTDQAAGALRDLGANPLDIANTLQNFYGVQVADTAFILKKLGVDTDKIADMLAKSGAEALLQAKNVVPEIFHAALSKISIDNVAELCGRLSGGELADVANGMDAGRLSDVLSKMSWDLFDRTFAALAPEKLGQISSRLTDGILASQVTHLSDAQLQSMFRSLGADRIASICEELGTGALRDTLRNLSNGQVADVAAELGRRQIDRVMSELENGRLADVLNKLSGDTLIRIAKEIDSKQLGKALNDVSHTVLKSIAKDLGAKPLAEALKHAEKATLKYVKNQINTSKLASVFNNLDSKTASRLANTLNADEAKKVVGQLKGSVKDVVKKNVPDNVKNVFKKADPRGWF